MVSNVAGKSHIKDSVSTTRPELFTLTTPEKVESWNSVEFLKITSLSKKALERTVNEFVESEKTMSPVISLKEAVSACI